MYNETQYRNMILFYFFPNILFIKNTEFNHFCIIILFINFLQNAIFLKNKVSL